MIGFLRGEVAEIEEHSIILDVHDVGYCVYLSSRDMSMIPRTGQQLKLHTYMHVKEDAMHLYGFLCRDDMSVFKLLIGINGIGPKAALGILSVMTADELRFAVLAGDVKTMTKAPGIGGKTAQKLILELKDKFSLEETFERQRGKIEDSMIQDQMIDGKSEAAEALTALGYSAAEALKAVKQVSVSEDMSVEQILKAALKNI